MKCLQSCSESGKKLVIPVIICTISLLAAVLLGLSVGAVTLPPSELLSAAGDPSGRAWRIVRYVRLPRLAASLLAGGALGASGAVIQKVLANPLASPGIIGVNSGAGFTAVLFMAFFPSMAAFMPLASFSGALAATVTVCILSRLAGGGAVTLVLAGVALNALLGAGVDTVTALAPDVLAGSYFFKLGGFTGASLSSIALPSVVIVLALGFVLIFHHRLDVLALGDDSARSLGLRVGVWRFVFLAAASALAGGAVSFAGLIGFVGLIVPHAVRFFTGSRALPLITCSTALGAAFLTLCDVIARSIFRPYELAVGILLAFIGGPFFIILLITRRRHRQ